MKEVVAKRVSNYELFYDLVFVLAIGNLTGLLHTEHPGLSHINVFLVANVMMINLWMLETIYLNKYGERDQIDIYTIIPSMFLIGNIALLLTVDLSDRQTYVWFNSLMAGALVMMMIQHLLRGRKIGFSKDLKAHIKVIGLELVLSSLLAIFGVYILNEWSLLLFIPIIFTPLLFVKDYDYDLINFPHMVERSQLITILSFGESVIAVVKTYPITTDGLLGALFFFGMSMLFVNYIGQTYLSIEHHQRISATTLLYAHLILIIGLNLFTVGIEMLPDHHHSAFGFGLYAAGILLFYAMLMLTTVYNKAIYRINVLQYLSYGFLVLASLLLSYFVRENLYLLALVLIFLTNATAMYHFSIIRKARAAKDESEKTPV